LEPNEQNAIGQVKIVAALRMMHLKNQTGTYISDLLENKGSVYTSIIHAHLGMFNTITIGWIGQDVKMTTRGIALQIMKIDDMPVAQFREDMVKKCQNLDEERGNPLAQQHLVPLGHGTNLGSIVRMRKSLFHTQNQFLHNTNMLKVGSCIT
jgi:hypothetical protein